MSADTHRLRAIQVITDMVRHGNTPATEDRRADLLCTALIALGVSVPEIREAMQFAILTSHEEP